MSANRIGWALAAVCFQAGIFAFAYYAILAATGWHPGDFYVGEAVAFCLIVGRDEWLRDGAK